MKQKKARGVIRIYTGGWMEVEGGITPAFVDGKIDILYETPESFRVEYSARFKRKHAKLCTSDIVRKDDKQRKVSYTLFTATDELPPHGPVKHATYTIGVLIPRHGGLEITSRKADVLIVEETDTHYRLRFAAAFAKKYPNLCAEWVRKAGNDPKIEIVS